MKATLFKTNIKRSKAAKTLANLIPLYFHGARVELQSIQKRFMMHITAPKVKPEKVVSTMRELGYKFEVADKVTLWRAE